MGLKPDALIAIAKEEKAEGQIHELPAGRKVVENDNGLPFLKKE